MWTHGGPSGFPRWLPLPEESNSPRKIMTRTALVTIALLSCLATPFLVNATAAPAKVAPIAIPMVASPADAVVANSENCRRVRVVYPPYGVSAIATTCAAPQAQR